MVAYAIRSSSLSTNNIATDFATMTFDHRNLGSFSKLTGENGVIGIAFNSGSFPIGSDGLEIFEGSDKMEKLYHKGLNCWTYS
jgi:hypothetical protein